MQLVIILPPLMFSILNFGTLIDPQLYALERRHRYWEFSLKQLIAFAGYTFVYYSPLCRLRRKHMKNSALWKLAALLGLYFAMLLIGSFLGNLFPHLIVLPFLVLLILSTYVSKDGEILLAKER